MRVATLIIWWSVAAASATELSAQRAPFRIASSSAGQVIRVEVPPEIEGPVKLRATVTKRDGTRVPLPAIVAERPQPPGSSIIEGPVIPPDCGGGKLVIEVVDPATGAVIEKSGSPVGF
jgi:hypothetical protein